MLMLSKSKVFRCWKLDLYLVVRKYFWMDLAMAGKIAWAVPMGSSVASWLAPGMFESHRSWRLIWPKESSAASVSLASRFRTFRSCSTWFYKFSFLISDEGLPLHNISHWCQHLCVSPPPPKSLYFSLLLRRHRLARQCHSSKNSRVLEFPSLYLEISHSFNSWFVRFSQGRIVEWKIEVVLL